MLTTLRLVHRLDVDGTACFEPADPSGEHHHHAICERCGKRDAFEDPELERLIDDVGARLGYDVGAHDIVLRGRCPPARVATDAGKEDRCGRAPNRSFRGSSVLRSACLSTVSPAVKP